MINIVDASTLQALEVSRSRSRQFVFLNCPSQIYLLQGEHLIMMVGELIPNQK